MQVPAQRLGHESDLIIPALPKAPTSEGNRSHARRRPAAGPKRIGQATGQRVRQFTIGAVLEMSQYAVDGWGVGGPRGHGEEAGQRLAGGAGGPWSEGAPATTAGSGRKTAEAALAGPAPGAAGASASGANRRKEQIEQEPPRLGGCAPQRGVSPFASGGAQRPCRIAPSGERSRSIAAGPRSRIRMEGKIRSAMGKIILIGARWASSSAICRRRTRI